jgi:hypothetical protein
MRPQACSLPSGAGDSGRCAQQDLMERTRKWGRWPQVSGAWDLRECGTLLGGSFRGIGFQFKRCKP